MTSTMNMHEIVSAVEGAHDLKSLEDLRVGILGKSGELTLKMKELGKLDPEARKVEGQVLNELRLQFTEALERKKEELETTALNERLKTETVDVSLPVETNLQGRLHPITRTITEITKYFERFGFEVRTGPEIETEFNNFTALNIPDHHPSRQEMDTFYVDHSGERQVLRTHTSGVQIRTMMTEKPPLRILAPGRVYRSDWDQTHTPMFHQIEGLVLDKGIHFGHLKGTIIDFCRHYFNLSDLPVRFRASHFPFTEPSAEVDIGYTRHNGTLKLGHLKEGTHGWLEILGCGMVHPKVLTSCGVDATEYQGFAFGMGIERITMLKHGVTDLRAFFESDDRWLSHYGFLSNLWE